MFNHTKKVYFASSLIENARKLTNEQLGLLASENVLSEEGKAYGQLLWITMTENERNECLKYYANQQTEKVPQIDEEKGFACIKLARLFGNFDKALSYLERFNKNYAGNNLIHDASLFSLPGPDEPWNKKLWQSIIEKNKPNNCNDFIMRILPFASKIENYVKENHDALVEKIKNNIIDSFKKNIKKIMLSTKSKSHSMNISKVGFKMIRRQ